MKSETKDDRSRRGRVRLRVVTSRYRGKDMSRAIRFRSVSDIDHPAGNQLTGGLSPRHRILQTVAGIRGQRAGKFACAAVPKRMHLSVHRSASHAARSFVTCRFLRALLMGIARLSLAARAANRRHQKQQRQRANGGNPANCERICHERHKVRLRHPRKRVNAQCPTRLS